MAKMCGTKCLFPELLQFSLAPPFPPDAMLDDSSASLSLRTTLHGGRGGESRIWPKERWFPCEKLIDGRGSAFCKLVPHNFGQDCSSKHRGSTVFRNTLSGRPPGCPLFGHVKLFLCLSNDCDSSSIRAIFSHINITGRALPIYRSDYLPTITSP